MQQQLNSLILEMIEQVNEQLADRRQLLVGFSGGLDSTVLLHILYQLHNKHLLGLQLSALHIHHGLSKNADQWTEHCTQFCRQLNIPIKCVRTQCIEQSKGIEAAARIARYQVFKQNLQTDQTLLLAHHLDDQCETFLLALKRGSGPTGLAAMPRLSLFGQGEIVRPLLNFSRQQLEKYAKYHQLNWIEDESNQDDRYDRNFLRLRVLPLLQQRWPYFARSVARSASLCAEQESLLDNLLENSLYEAQTTDNRLSIDALQRYSPEKRNAIIRRWLARQSVTMPSRQQLEKIWLYVALSKPDATPLYQLGEWEIRRFKNYLYVLPKLSKLSSVKLIWSNTQNKLALPDNLGFLVRDKSNGTKIRLPQQKEIVSIRFGTQGNVKIIGRNGSRSIKKLWQELQVPPWQRGRIPLVYFDDILIAAVGLFVTEMGKPVNNSQFWYVDWQQKSGDFSLENHLS